MTHKSHRQPLCRYCGKPIDKHTETVYVFKAKPNFRYHLTYVVGILNSKAECRRRTNLQVVSVEYSYETDIDHKRTGERHIHKFTTWDRESYVDPYFCTGTCTRLFAYMLAREGRCAPPYNEAIRRRQGGGKT